MLNVEYIDISAIKPYRNNAKKHPKSQIDQIAKSITEMGFNDPIGIWHGEIVEGHGRYLAAKKLKLKQVPVIKLDHLTDEQRREYCLVHNQLTLNSDYDFPTLEQELDDILKWDADFAEKYDFDMLEIESLTEEVISEHEKNVEKNAQTDTDYLNTGKRIYEGVGKYDIPEILPVYDLPEIREWIGFNYVLSDDDPDGKAVHFFIQDYQFERLWNNPDKYIDKLKRYVCIASPDFSPMDDMPFAAQIFNHYRKHWVARYLQEHGVTVIPTVRASSSTKSWDYCFDGEPTNSIVMYSAQWTRLRIARDASQKEYDELVSRLSPTKIFVYQNSDKQYLDFKNQNIEIVKAFNQGHWRR